MKVNNVYQRRTISLPKLIIVIGLIILALVVFIWRLYYERLQTGTVDTFAEFVGLEGVAGKDKDAIQTLEKNLMAGIDGYLENKLNSGNVGNGGNMDNFQNTALPEDNPSLGNIVNSENINNSEDRTDLYIPKFSEESLNSINKIYNLSEGEQKTVYLTFDDGPSKDVTPLILDILKEENVYATFFVLGSKVDENPDILERIYEEGHYIANHGYSHVYSQIYGYPNAVLEEYNKCEESIRKALRIPNYNTHLFRYPGGSVGGGYNAVKSESLKILKENEVAILDWNCLTKDSEGNYPKETLIANFKQTSAGKNNLVILMHDASGKILVADVLKEVISSLKNDGYKFRKYERNFLKILDKSH